MATKTKLMSAMQITIVSRLAQNREPLKLVQIPVPQPGDGQVLVKIQVCAVCHTELDEIEGRTPPDCYPRTPGHQVIGEVCQIGKACRSARLGQRVGVAWLYRACGRCEFCGNGLENLCADFQATGRDADGGYAEYMVVDEAYAHPIPDSMDAVEAAPLLCAGAVGYRALKLCGLNNTNRLGFSGFGASAHLVLKLVKRLYPDVELYVFARDQAQREFARSLGADWTGDTRDRPDKLLHAVIDTTPAWQPVVSALEALLPAGRLVINAIRKQNDDIGCLESIDYGRHLWMEKTLRSVANVTASDIREFLELAARFDITPQVTRYRLDQANHALVKLSTGGGFGAHVLQIKKNPVRH